MERVTFLIEDSGDRIGCMLNPESLVMRRTAGVRRIPSLNGPVTGSNPADDILLFTGGGRTDLRFDLLFDVSIPGSSIVAKDVRELTGPLWKLAENSKQTDGSSGPSPVRFIWGKSWNILGVIAALAERFDRFSQDGAPQRSWLSLKFVRINEPSLKQVESPGDLDHLHRLIHEMDQGILGWFEEKAGQLESVAEAGAAALGRLDLAAFKRFGDAAYWRVIAASNKISDIFDISVELNLSIALKIQTRSSAHD